MVMEKSPMEVVNKDLKRNDKGIFYLHGMGCPKYLNCFECEAKKCTFNCSGAAQAHKWLSNPGNGIKVW